ncbi:hypothetical protein ACWKSP_36575 [Micromonosporaceae bacterium Da 78-11]
MRWWVLVPWSTKARTRRWRLAEVRQWQYAERQQAAERSEAFRRILDQARRGQ